MGERDRGEECFRHFIRIRKSKGSSMDEGVATASARRGAQLHWQVHRAADAGAATSSDGLPPKEG